MDHRFPRQLLGVAIAVSLSGSLFAAMPAQSSGHEDHNQSLITLPQLLIPSDNQLTAAVVLPSVDRHIQPQQDSLDGVRRKSNEYEDAIREGLTHSSTGMQALTAGDRGRAQRELETSIRILSQLPEAATLNDLRLQLSEQTALLKAALAGSRPAEVVDGQIDEQKEENGADTEAAPGLVVSGEELNLAPSGSEITSLSDLDLSDFDVPIELNEHVKAHILYYQTQKRRVMSRALERSGRYLPMMRQIFRDQGLPQDLVNLAYVESAFNYRAYSKAKASGLWQFIKATGNRYGMRVSHWLDERRDPEKATRGAAAYLKELYEMFHSWPLALAAYNAGEQRVQRAIDTQGTTDFWSLRLPKETQLFVPAFMAVTIIAKDPARYGFTAPVEMPWEVERATVPGAIELRSVARVVGVSPELLRDLNPALTRGITPAHASDYEIVLPPSTKEILLANLDQLPRHSYREPAGAAGKRPQAARGKTKNKRMVASARGAGSTGRTVAGKKVAASSRAGGYVVKRGDTLWKIARAYGVRPEELRQWNDLKPQTKLKPGRTLQVVAQAAKNDREISREAPASAVTPVRYRVRRGDTLWEIARVHDVTPDELRRWNDLGRQTTLSVGQELKIRVDQS
ncbi:MAG: hypothetical protein C3F08_03465 [Candidatus Methylomirabilota bacterium]|nr:MAG: hypothetical protein C3F08_03465 [candidate division NC10 bacterium]